MAPPRKRVRNGKVTWQVRYYDPAGRLRGKSFDRQVDAKRWQTENESAKNKGSWVDPAAGKITFGEWAERWYATTAGLRPASRRVYRQTLDYYVLPHFARAPLAGIDALSVREWMARLAAQGLGARTVAHARAALKRVLDSAVEGGRLNRNVVTLVKPPKRARKEMHFLDAAQVEQLAEAIGPSFATLIRFAAYTGLRPSEQTALRVKRLDLLRGTVRVAEAAPAVNGHLEWGPTKTGEARTVKLPRFLCNELAAHLADRPHGPEDLVFTMALGGPLNSSRFGMRYFKPAVRAAGLPDGLRYYDLRHTAATLMIATGANIKVVQRQMGHTTASMTLDVYGHLLPEDLDAVVERLDQMRGTAMDARAAGMWPQGGPEVVPLNKSAGQ